MRVLVTGASGFLGGHVVEGLNNEGHEIAVMARQTSDLSSIISKVDEVRYGDMTDSCSMAEATRGMDAVCHCAGAVRMVAPYRELRETNVEGTRRLVRASAINGVRRVVYASSMGVYGMDGKGITSRYGYCRSKALAEQAFFEECGRGEVEGVALRPGVIYGPRDYTASYPMFRMVEEDKVFLIGDGNTRFPLIYIKDVVDAFLGSLDNEEVVGMGFDLPGEAVTPRRVFSSISECLGIDFEPRTVGYRAAMMTARWNELRSVLSGYRREVMLSRFVVQLYGRDHEDSFRRTEKPVPPPKVGLEDGMSRTSEWYLSVREASANAG